MLETSSPEMAYVTKCGSNGVPNIKFPGTQAQATQYEGVAQTRLNALYAGNENNLVTTTVVVSAGAIPVAS
jgi:hypothetical protein